MDKDKQEYHKYFEKFYKDYFLFQSNKKKYIHCEGCESKKKFLISENTLVYSCGGNTNKCSHEYTIHLPEYSNIHQELESINRKLNGCDEYKNNDNSQSNLDKLSKFINIDKELNQRKKNNSELEKHKQNLIQSYSDINNFKERKELLLRFIDLQHKNISEKRKLMSELMNSELSEEKKSRKRIEYAQIVKDDSEIKSIINELDKDTNTTITSKKSDISVKHNHNEKSVPKPTESKPIQEIIQKKYSYSEQVDIIKEFFKIVDPDRDAIQFVNDRRMKGHPIGKRIPTKPWLAICRNLHEIYHIDPLNIKNITQEQIKEAKKYTYTDQVDILKKFYQKVDPDKDDIVSIVDRRRPSDTPIGTRIPIQPWLELCMKLKDKYNLDPLNMNTTSLPEKEESQKKEQSQKKEESSKLFNPDIVLQFYSKSRDLKPGKGSGEKIPKESIPEYEELSKIKDWRKMLSNFYKSEFTLDNKKWLSVEHYYQGSKFKKNNPEFYEKFSLDSGSDISKDPNMAKSAGGKSGKSKGVLLRPKNIIIDDDFFKSRSSKEMKLAQQAKYDQNDKLKKMLLLTNDAKLTHFSRGSPPITFTETMEIRKSYKKN